MQKPNSQQCCSFYIHLHTQSLTSTCRCLGSISVYLHASVTMAFFCFFKCVILAEKQLGMKSMKNSSDAPSGKRSIRAKSSIAFSIQVFVFVCFFQFWNYKDWGGRCITNLNAIRHISLCLNIPIYSKTVSALLKWIVDGKSRHWGISYDTTMFCLCQHVSLWHCCNLAGASWVWRTDIQRPRLVQRLSYLRLVK